MGKQQRDRLCFSPPGWTMAPELCPLQQPENTALQNVLISTSGWANSICFHRGTFKLHWSLHLFKVSIFCNYILQCFHDLGSSFLSQKVWRGFWWGHLYLHILYCFAIRHRMVLKRMCINFNSWSKESISPKILHTAQAQQNQNRSCSIGNYKNHTPCKSLFSFTLGRNFRYADRQTDRQVDAIHNFRKEEIVVWDSPCTFGVSTFWPFGVWFRDLIVVYRIRSGVPLQGNTHFWNMTFSKRKAFKQISAGNRRKNSGFLCEHHKPNPAPCSADTVSTDITVKWTQRLSIRASADMKWKFSQSLQWPFPFPKGWICLLSQFTGVSGHFLAQSSTLCFLGLSLI